MHDSKDDIKLRETFKTLTLFTVWLEHAQNPVTYFRSISVPFQGNKDVIKVGLQMDRLVSKVLFNDCGTESEEICSIASWHQTRKGCWCSVPVVWVTSLGPKIKLWGHRMIKGMTNKNLPFFFFCCFLVKHWVLLALQTPKNLSKWKTLRGNWHVGWTHHNSHPHWGHNL